MQLWQGHKPNEFDAIHASDFIDRSSAGRSGDREAFKNGIAQLYEVFPDFIARTEILAIDEAKGLATISWSATGCHLATFMGFPATGRAIRFTGIEIIRCLGGRVVERWGEWNEGSIRDQLQPS